MKKTFNFFVWILLFTAAQSFAQYSTNDRALVKTTFERTFDKKIITGYLHSDSPARVNAALLSIAQSGDSSFIPEILDLNFGEHSKFICFALGQLGKNSASSAFLFSKLNHRNIPDSVSGFIIKAIGKIGSAEDFSELKKIYEKNSGRSFPGISDALYEFYARKVIDKKTAEDILRNELNGEMKSTREKSSAAFAIARLGLSKNFSEDIFALLDKYLSPKINEYDNLVLVQNLMDNLRRAGYSHFGGSYFKRFLGNGSPLVRILATSLLANFHFETRKDVDKYFEFFADNNPNVTRQAAVSLKRVKTAGELRKFFKDKIEKLIVDTSLTANTRGELFLSYRSLFNLKFEKIVSRFGKDVGREFIYRCAASVPESHAAFEYLTDRFNESGEGGKDDILSALVNFKKFSGTKKFGDIIFSSLNSGSPVLISMALEGIDSAFAANNVSKLKPAILLIADKYKDDPNFLESIQAASDAADLIGKDFSNELLNVLRNSKVYALKKYAETRLGLPPDFSNANDELFNRLWKDAFNYRSALISTARGNFTITFNPEYAPVSTGNFCSLAAGNFFKGIIFHRVVPGFVIQGGDPTGTGWGGPDYSIVSEFSPLHYSISAVGMASAGKDTEGSQWFVTTGDYPHLDGRYTIFGYVTDGMDVVNKIDQDDVILSVSLTH